MGNWVNMAKRSLDSDNGHTYHPLFHGQTSKRDFNFSIPVSNRGKKLFEAFQTIIYQTCLPLKEAIDFRHSRIGTTDEDLKALECV